MKMKNIRRLRSISGAADTAMGVGDLDASGEVWEPLPNWNYYIFIFHQIFYLYLIN
jgi:hypothetical protein